MRTSATVLALVCIGGCATSPRELSSDVWSYSQWAQHIPATYAFERVPTWNARGEHQRQVEQAARGALEAAGFVEAADARNADVLVQVAARGRTATIEHSSAASRHNPFSDRDPTYAKYPVREVAVLIRDPDSRRMLYAGRASNRGRAISQPEILAAMFEATMKDFPYASVNPRQVPVELAP